MIVANVLTVRAKGVLEHASTAASMGGQTGRMREWPPKFSAYGSDAITAQIEGIQQDALLHLEGE